MHRPFTSVTALRASADMSDCLKAHLNHLAHRRTLSAPRRRWIPRCRL